MKIAAIGECMIELRAGAKDQLGQASMHLAFGGDSLNTAVYLARLGQSPSHDDTKPYSVDYLTALGDDAFSKTMQAQWAEEGLGLDKVRILPGELPGLYAITTDGDGERSFYYWRQQAAARQYWHGLSTRQAAAQLAGYGAIYFSGITLSIYDDADRQIFFAALQNARQAGARIFFDTNYRPRGWGGPAEARGVFEKFLPLVDVALPSIEDLEPIFGTDQPAELAQQLAAFGVEEIVLKNGPSPCHIFFEGSHERVDARPVKQLVDTTAAGDSFDAAYIWSRLQGASPMRAAALGHHLAATVVGYPGALIPRNAMPELEAPII